MIKNRMLTALLEEYQRSAIDLKKILSTLSQNIFEEITDKDTKNLECNSIQNITLHVIQSGYTYVNYINSVNNGEWLEYSNSVETPKKGVEEINQMLDYTAHTFDKIGHKTNEEIEAWKFDTRWGVTYDFEQLVEHAIVHILRHRRQIEIILLR